MPKNRPTRDDKKLSDVGRLHARELVKFFRQSPEVTRLGAPSAIFATGLGKGGKGQRCQETVGPLAQSLKLTIQTPFKAEENAALAKQILQDEELQSKTVLICWTKERIPELMKALGVAEPPPKLEENEYDRVFVLTPDRKGTKVVTLKQEIGFTRKMK